MSDRHSLLDRLAHAIAAISRPHPIRVAIDGVDAAGKTSLADDLAGPLQGQGYPVIRASLDSFHHPQAVRHRRGAASPEGYYYDSFDYPAVKSLLLDPLGPGGSLRYQTALFDGRSEVALSSPVRTAGLHSVLLFDGVFLFRPELEAGWDLRIWVEVTFEVALSRAIQRDAALFGGAAAVRERYQQRYIPGQRLYLAQCRPREQAHLIVDNNDSLHPELHVGRNLAAVGEHGARTVEGFDMGLQQKGDG
jgi:uridine kinase